MLSRVGAGPGSTALVSLSPREGKYLLFRLGRRFLSHERWSACKSLAIGLFTGGEISSSSVLWMVGLSGLYLSLHMLSSDVDLFL